MADQDDRKSALDLEWENRVLCRDGNCIGVIGKDGRCKECGLPYDPDTPIDSEENVKATRHEEHEDNDQYEGQGDIDAGDSLDGADTTLMPDKEQGDDHWKSRTLCIDGNCIGVIGKNGKCKECGKPHPDFS